MYIGVCVYIKLYTAHHEGRTRARGRVKMIPMPSSNALFPASRRRAPARLRQPEPRMWLAVRGVPKGALRTHSA